MRSQRNARFSETANPTRDGFTLAIAELDQAAPTLNVHAVWHDEA
ncbi:MAG TPA: hypothetical protein VN729_09690 [Ktedonobacteraceae bacterium]|nr:hypothetical protein [Ktedonobacteraceae bacterium]